MHAGSRRHRGGRARGDGRRGVSRTSHEGHVAEDVDALATVEPVGAGGAQLTHNPDLVAAERRLLQHSEQRAERRRVHPRVLLSAFSRMLGRISPSLRSMPVLRLRRMISDVPKVCVPRCADRAPPLAWWVTSWLNMCHLQLIRRPGVVEEGLSSAMFTVSDNVGQLTDVLNTFKKHGVNLSYIESRPSKGSYVPRPATPRAACLRLASDFAVSCARACCPTGTTTMTSTFHSRVCRRTATCVRRSGGAVVSCARRRCWWCRAGASVLREPARDMRGHEAHKADSGWASVSASECGVRRGFVHAASRVPLRVACCAVPWFPTTLGDIDKFSRKVCLQQLHARSQRRWNVCVGVGVCRGVCRRWMRARILRATTRASR
jgi:hypothetical protein